MVNLIPFNRVSGLPYKSPTRESVVRFLSILRNAGLNAQVRERKGDEIDAACGQLRRIQLTEPAMTGDPLDGGSVAIQNGPA
jgi:23S rRNA (adenine2503-C2)-methyltransferase